MIKCETITVTPELASDWLESNKGNRKLRERTVKRYAADMMAGKWELNHQGIAFDPDGVLIDGQHRLKAVVEADVPVDILVFRGVPEKGNIDVHVKRSVSDLTGIPTQMVSVVNDLFRRCAGKETSNPSVSQAVEFYEKYKDGIDFAVANITTQKIGLRSVTIKGVIAQAWYHVDTDILTRFCEVFSTGMTDSPADIAAFKLRDKILTSDSKDIRNKAPLIENAIRLFCDRTPIVQLCPIQKEIYPL